MKNFLEGKSLEYKFTLLISLLFILISCDNALFNLIKRPQKDPELFELKVDSFTKQYEIHCSWEADELADKYILMRSEDNPKLNFEEVYFGKSLSYNDSNLKDNTKYIYRLDKLRGEKRFIGKKHYLGIYGDKVEDTYEPNDKVETATYLEKAKQGNLYYYTSAKGIQVSDIDWYRVRIKANRQVSLSLTYDASTPNFKVILPPNGEEKTPGNNVAFQIRNDTEQEKEFYFSVGLDKGQFSSTGASIFYTYTLKLLSETAISE